MGRNLKNLQRILDIGVVPIIRTKSAEEAMKVAEAINKGGVKVLEVTMTVPNALKVMEKVTSEFKGEILLGAGTVLDPETARASILAGAEFIVTPCLNPEVIKICRRYSVPVIPGTMTPTEILTAWELGADIVKVFPIDVIGGPKYIKAVKAPLPQVALVPTGGVTLENTPEYIKAGADAVAAGTSLVDTKAVTEGRYDLIAENAKKFVEAVKNARG
jgi:2-dehydro-3-deoxyphosphogluconate aldolase / (4S)-4-hydroxy-2-oxoglutarate aldolase